MIRLLLNDDAFVTTEAATRFGGLPLIPLDSEFQWPCCSICKGPMQFLGQIAPEDSDAGQVLLLFMCQNDPGVCCEWEADGGEIVYSSSRSMAMASLPRRQN
jgi:hypothetical protein